MLVAFGFEEAFYCDGGHAAGRRAGAVNGDRPTHLSIAHS